MVEPTGGTDPASIVANIALQEGIDQLSEVFGVSVPLADVDPVGFIGSILGLGGIFGGDSDRNIRVPALDPTALEKLGIPFKGAGAISADSFRDFGAGLAVNTAGLRDLAIRYRTQAKTLGFTDVEVDQVQENIGLTRISRIVPVSPSHAIQLQQQMLNLSAFFLTTLDTLALAQQTQSLTTTPDVISPTPLTPLPTQPINVTVNIPQTTLPFPTGIQTPTQPAPPTTLQNWWQSFIKAGRVASGISQAIQFPFFVRDIFSDNEEEPLAFFGGEEFFDFQFPQLEGQTETNLITLPPLDPEGSINIKELEGSLESSTGAFTVDKFWIPLFIGLLVAYVATRKRKK